MTDNKKEVNFSASTTTTRAPRPNPKPSGKSVAQKQVDDSDEEGPTIQDIVDYQNIDIQQRLAHLTYADLENVRYILEKIPQKNTVRYILSSVKLGCCLLFIVIFRGRFN